MSTPGITCGQRHRSYPEIHDRAGRIALGLRDLGISQGDRVAVLLRNEIEFVEIGMAIARLGAVPVPVNWHWKQSELAYLVADCEAAAVFAHSDMIPTVRAAVPDGIPIVQVELTEALATAYRLPVENGKPGDVELEEWIATQNGPNPGAVDAPLGVIYTSGTTGKPKGILRQPVGPEQRAVVMERLFSAFGLKAGLSTMVPAPLYHSAPNAHAMFAAAAGRALTIMPKFSPEEFLATIERHRIGHTQVVPTMFVRLLQLPAESRQAYDLSSLQAVVHAAAPCPPEVKRQMIDWWGPILHEYYGGSETGCIVACDSHEWLAHPGTVGRLLPGCDLKIYREDGSEAPRGVSGEVFLDAGFGWPDFTYIGDDEKRRQIDRGGYVSIGDGGRLDEDGFLYLTDRISDMVISAGVNIYPVEIENFLANVPGVRDAAVFGVPDAEMGEVLVAHVDTDPACGLTEDDIRAQVRANLAGYKVPKTIVIDRDLPRDESGKLFKRRIRERYLSPSR